MPSFSLPKLPYSYDALEPHIDTKTMEIHHTKHHQTYINNLNKTIEDTKFYTNSTLLDILQNVIEDQRETGKDLMKIRNNAGGHFNHSFFWLVMGPDSNVKDIKEPLMEAINTCFGSFDNLKQRFTEEGVSLFGSGFVWLCYDVISKQLIVSTSKDQDDPLMFEKGYIPMLTLDVWEHAYYLKYQNVRKNYIDAWWNVVNWKMVNMFYDEYAMKHVMVEIENDGTLKKKADE